MTLRRVVTGVDQEGRSCVVSDSSPPLILTPAGALAPEFTYVWTTDAIPDAPNTGAETTRADQEFFPGPSGSRVVVITYPAGYGTSPPASTVDTDLTPNELGSIDLESNEFEIEHDRLFMHATPTIDYGIVLSGEMTMILEEGDEVILGPTDVIIQNGAVHGWRNASNDPSVVAFVILGAHDAPANRG
jgi:hypothetical protein